LGQELAVTVPNPPFSQRPLNDSTVPTAREAASAEDQQLPGEEPAQQEEDVVAEMVAARTATAPSEPAIPAPAIIPPVSSRKPESPTPPAVARVLQRRDKSTEVQLRKQLAWMPRVRSLTLSAMVDLVRSFRESFRVSGRVGDNVDLGPALLLEVRPDLVYLPLRKGNACRLNARSAATLNILSRELHGLLDVAAAPDANGRRPPPTLLTEILRQQRRGRRPEWLRPEAIPVLLQILGHEESAVRRMLVELLDEIPGEVSSGALAQRAVFDLSPDVRELALRALDKRPREEYRKVLMNGLRYPWPPAADHAAEALVFLNDQDAAPSLVGLLKRPDPSAPAAAAGSRPYVRELVQIDHAANCLMCHAPSVSASDPARGPVPGLVVRGGGGGGWGGSPATPQSLNSFLVRADVAYLRQDFSVGQPVTDPATGLEASVRFDYILRMRLAKSQEVATFRAKANASYPQREAVLFALRELTGKDAGTSADAWLAFLPRAEPDYSHNSRRGFKRGP
jgi:hypothetical protein